MDRFMLFSKLFSVDIVVEWLVEIRFYNFLWAIKVATYWKL